MEKWVKIIDTKLPTYWYSSMIGKTYKVEDSHNNEQWLALEGEWPDGMEGGWINLIDKEDTVIINKEGKYNGERIKHKFI
tara:strand:- start:2015 stop:2254 length:240 start_codon:yes stop_codon:yes gene_type:complete